MKRIILTGFTIVLMSQGVNAQNGGPYAQSLLEVPKADAKPFSEPVSDSVAAFKHLTVRSNVDSALKPNQVRVINKGTINLFFYLRPTKGQWVRFELKPNHYATYDLADEIWLSTALENNQFEKRHYALPKRSRYKLAWNTESNCWDVFEDDSIVTVLPYVILR